ncbi:MAG TPA: hypothetical protein VET65_05115 [Candidatus Limnocylindrales bacterium]|nr:hypothetical protein [Candidatus Limnocylindrales bacterium]
MEVSTVSGNGFAIVYGGKGRRKAITRMAAAIGVRSEAVAAGDARAFGNHIGGAIQRLQPGDLFWLTLFGDSTAGVVGVYLTGFRPGVRIIVLSARPFGELAGRYGRIHASVIWIAGGGDAMIEAVPAVFARGGFEAGYPAFYRALVEHGAANPPTYRVIGALDPGFEAQPPFWVMPVMPSSPPQWRPAWGMGGAA